jgi:broad specificity phosphatase PhoE
MIKTTTIHTIRHAETEYNRQNRYAGTIDIPLSERGVADTLEAAKKLAGYKFDVVISSTLRRAIRTAELLVPNGIPVTKTDLCRERSYGMYQGLTADEVRDFQPPVLYIEVGGDVHSVNPPGAEPFEDLRERAKKFHRYLAKNFWGSSIFVVSHGVFLQQYHGVLNGLNCIESLAVHKRNLELTTFEFKGRRLENESAIRLIKRDQVSW